MRKPSKPVAICSAIKMADLISSHHVPSLGETLTWVCAIAIDVRWKMCRYCSEEGKVSFTKKTVRSNLEKLLDLGRRG